ncbi:hypothetical protein PFISCL1PPCAC_21437, partial [Pristionchus fissidentatus]
IPLPDISLEEFIELLYVIYPSERRITSYSCAFILALADRFQIQCATNRAEAYLTKTSKVSNAEKFDLSNRFRLERLQKLVLSSFKTLASLQELNADPHFKRLDASTKDSM